LDWFVAQTRTQMIDNLIKNARVTSSGRKLLTSREKVYLVEEWQSSGLSCPEFCRRHGLIASQLYKWRKDANSGAVMGVKNEGELHSKTELEILRKENDELKKALGEATLDIKILKKKAEMDQQRNRKLSS
jgi:transposase-like protein